MIAALRSGTSLGLALARARVRIVIARFARISPKRAAWFAGAGAAAAAALGGLTAFLNLPWLLQNVLFAIAFAMVATVVLLVYAPARESPFWHLFVVAWIGAGVSSWAGSSSGLEIWGGLGFVMLILYVARGGEVAWKPRLHATGALAGRVREKLALPYRAAPMTLAVIVGLIGLLALFSGSVGPAIYGPWSALPSLTRTWVALQQTSWLHLDTFDAFERVFSGCCGVVGKWRIDVYLETFLALFSAFFAARSNGLRKSEAAAVAAMFAFGWWTLGEVQFALLPLWAVPLIFTFAMRDERGTRLSWIALLAIAVLNPYSWLLLAVLAIFRVARRERLRYDRGLTFAVPAFVGFVIQTFAAGPQVVDHWLLGLGVPAAVAIALIVVLGASVRAQRHMCAVTAGCFLVAGLLVGATLLTGIVGEVARSLFPAYALAPLVAAGLFGTGMLAIYCMRELWRRSLLAVAVVFALSLLSAAAIPGPDRREVAIDESLAYQHLAKCPAGRVADFPIPVSDSVQDHLYTSAALNARHEHAVFDPALRGANLSAPQVRALVNAVDAKYVIAHFDDNAVSETGDVVNVPDRTSFQDLRLIDASVSGTWLYSTQNC